LFTLLGIKTPQAFALIEKKSGPFVTKSWFISEYLEGESLLDHWSSCDPEEDEIAWIKDLFSVMASAGISHGDMKATNIICNDKGFSVIDFDGSKEHRTPRAAARFLSRDKQRFLKNWPDEKKRQYLQATIFQDQGL
jgi:predicted Ser/Thr protein kinase